MKNAAEIKKLNGEIESLEKRVALLVAKTAHPKLIAEREAELKDLYRQLEALELGEDGVEDVDGVDVDEPTPTPTKKAQGRPKGSKNRPKAGVGAAAKIGVPTDDKPDKDKPKAVAKLAGTYSFQATGKIAKSGKSAEFAPVKGSPFAGQGALYVTLSSLPEGCESFEVTITA